MIRSNIEHRQYPIGALSSEETGNILSQPLCADPVTIDNLSRDWRAKNQLYLNLPIPSFNIANPNFRPVSTSISASVKQKIDDVIRSYRNFLPANYGLEFVPLNFLVTPQKSVILERARAFASAATKPLSDDENAEMCLGTPISKILIDAKHLGATKHPQNPNQLIHLYQFESDNQDIRYLDIPPRGALQTVNWSVVGTPYALNLETVPISVGPGPSPVQIVKVQIGNISTQQGQQVPLYRFILWNGVHRVFRLAELGNTEVAAFVHELPPEMIPDPLVDTQKNILLSSPRPLLVTDLADSNISRPFDWVKAKRLIKLQVAVNAETTFVT